MKPNSWQLEHEDCIYKTSMYMFVNTHENFMYVTDFIATAKNKLSVILFQRDIFIDKIYSNQTPTQNLLVLSKYRGLSIYKEAFIKVK